MKQETFVLDWTSSGSHHSSIKSSTRRGKLHSFLNKKWRPNRSPNKQMTSDMLAQLKKDFKLEMEVRSAGPPPPAGPP